LTLPPGTPEPEHNFREDEAYQEARAELLREASEGELHSPDERDPFPPTRYE